MEALEGTGDAIAVSSVLTYCSTIDRTDQRD